MSELGDYLKKLRGSVSLREAAKRSGISHSYINSLEAGSHPKTGAPINPTPDILRSLAKAYNHSYDDLMVLAGYMDEDGNISSIEETEMESMKREIREIVSMAKTDEDVKSILHIIRKVMKE